MSNPSQMNSEVKELTAIVQTTSSSSNKSSSDETNGPMSDIPLLDLLGASPASMTPEARAEFVKEIRTLRASAQALKAKLVRENTGAKKTAKAESAKPVDVGGLMTDLGLT